jgi:hypothetical protein
LHELCQIFWKSPEEGKRKVRSVKFTYQKSRINILAKVIRSLLPEEKKRIAKDLTTNTPKGNEEQEEDALSPCLKHQLTNININININIAGRKESKH